MKAAGMEDILAKALGQDASQLAAAEKRDLLVRLLSRLAHEIRNPLSSLDIHIQLLEEDLDALAPQARGQFNPRLQVIHGELHRLETIVERFLRLAGPSALELESVDPAKLLAHICDLLRPDAATRNIEIVAEADPDLPGLTADPLRLTQVLLNLAINAVQAIQRDGRVELSARRGSPAGTIAFGVKDNGPGIPEDKLTEIFDPYFTTKEEGSGLGLWIAQQIALAHGGTISAQNIRPHGAWFSLNLPAQFKGKPNGQS
jgi:two-component system sensor histidine kinase HydH